MPVRLLENHSRLPIKKAWVYLDIMTKIRTLVATITKSLTYTKLSLILADLCVL